MGRQGVGWRTGLGRARRLRLEEVLCGDGGSGAPLPFSLGSCCPGGAPDHGDFSCCHGAASLVAVVEVWLCPPSRHAPGWEVCSAEAACRETWRVCSPLRRRSCGSYCCCPALMRR